MMTGIADDCLRLVCDVEKLLSPRRVYTIVRIALGADILMCEIDVRIQLSEYINDNEIQIRLQF